MARRKITTTVYLTVEQRDALNALHAQTRVPVAEYIRQGVDMILAREAHRLPPPPPPSIDSYSLDQKTR